MVVNVGIAATIGAYEIGVLVSYALFGMTTTQMYIYYSRFADDSRKLKGLVAFVWACELGHALCVGHTVYFHTLSGYMHPDIFLESPWTLHAAFFIAGFIVACVQGFFGFRVYMLSKRLSIPVLVWIMALLRLAASIAIPLFTLTPVVHYYIAGAKGELFFTSAWILGVGNDLLITTALVFLLRRQRADVHERTMVLADKIIAWSIETGMITSAVAIAELICFLTMPKNWIWIAIFTIEARMFANSFLASLNGRTTLRAMSDGPLTFVFPTIRSFSNGVELTNLRPIESVLGDKATSSDVYRLQVESQIE